MSNSNIGPQLEWLFQHASLIAWPTVCVLAWRFSRWLTSTTLIATKAVAQIDTMASDHFPAMKASLEKQDTYLHSVDESLKTMVEKISAPPMFVTAQKAARKRKR